MAREIGHEIKKCLISKLKEEKDGNTKETKNTVRTKEDSEKIDVEMKEDVESDDVQMIEWKLRWVTHVARVVKVKSYCHQVLFSLYLYTVHIPI